MTWLDKVGQKNQTFDERVKEGVNIADSFSPRTKKIIDYSLLGFGALMIIIISFSLGFGFGFERQCKMVEKDTATQCREYICENFGECIDNPEKNRGYNVNLTNKPASYIMG